MEIGVSNYRKNICYKYIFWGYCKKTLLQSLYSRYNKQIYWPHNPYNINAIAIWARTTRYAKMTNIVQIFSALSTILFLQITTTIRFASFNQLDRMVVIKIENGVNQQEYVWEFVSTVTRRNYKIEISVIKFNIKKTQRKTCPICKNIPSHIIISCIFVLFFLLCVQMDIIYKIK